MELKLIVGDNVYTGDEETILYIIKTFTKKPKKGTYKRSPETIEKMRIARQRYWHQKKSGQEENENEKRTNNREEHDFK